MRLSELSSTAKNRTKSSQYCRMACQGGGGGGEQKHTCTFYSAPFASTATSVKERHSVAVPFVTNIISHRYK